MLIAAVETRRSDFRGGPRSRRRCRAAGAPATPARHIRRRATFSGRNRRRHPARSRADRIRQSRECRQWPCGSDAASAWCRSAWCGPTPDRTPRARRAFRAASRFAGASARRAECGGAPLPSSPSKSAVLKWPSTTTLPLSCTRGASGCERLARVDDRRQFVDLDLDAIGNVLGFRRASARTTAIGSPTKRTTSFASSGCSIGR